MTEAYIALHLPLIKINFVTTDTIALAVVD